MVLRQAEDGAEVHAVLEIVVTAQPCVELAPELLASAFSKAEQVVALIAMEAGYEPPRGGTLAAEKVLVVTFDVVGEIRLEGVPRERVVGDRRDGEVVFEGKVAVRNCAFERALDERASFPGRCELALDPDLGREDYSVLCWVLVRVDQSLVLVVEYFRHPEGPRGEFVPGKGVIQKESRCGDARPLPRTTDRRLWTISLNAESGDTGLELGIAQAADPLAGRQTSHFCGGGLVGTCRMSLTGRPALIPSDGTALGVGADGFVTGSLLMSFSDSFVVWLPCRRYSRRWCSFRIRVWRLAGSC